MRSSAFFNLAVFAMAIAVPAASAQHSNLLPMPTEIHYGIRSIPIRNLSIRFASAPSAEDRFAAKDLSKLLEAKTGLKVPITDGIVAQRSSIVLRRTGAIDALPVHGEIPGPESREAYRIAISPNGVEISGRSTAAIYYGIHTLAQMAEHSGSSAIFPEATVHDWPALAYRATLIDVGSEGPMSKLEQVKQQIDFLALWKANQLFFYSEGNIELKGYPLLNPQSRFTQSEVREIVAYARERHIDVVPAIEMYGHLHDLFRIEKYSDLADFPHGGEFDPNNPRVKTILKDWARQFADLFPSPFVDIGFDETWSIQKNAAHAGANSAESSPVQLFVRQLTTVAQLFQNHGKTVMAYADIMVKIPGIIPQLPKGLIALPWWYEPRPDPEYKRWLTPLVENHIPHMVTSGVSSWDEIVPDFAMSFENIDTLIAAGRKSHSLGLVNTLWTDDGQMLMQMSWSGMAYGAIAAWQTAPVSRAEFFNNYSNIIYSPLVAPHMAQAFFDLDAAESSLQRAVGQETALELWQDPFRPAMLAQLRSHREDLRQARLKAESAQEHLYEAKSLSGTAEPMHLNAFLGGARMIDYAGMKFLYATEIADVWASLPTSPTREQLLDSIDQGISNEAHSRSMDLMDGITELKYSYKQEWLAEYTPYRLQTALGRWNAEYEFWRRLQTNVNNLRHTFKTGDTLPSIEAMIGSCDCKPPNGQIPIRAQ